MLVSSTPKLIAFEPTVGTFSRDVMDFWRPLYSKDAVVDGQYSVTCYLESLKGAYSACVTNGGKGPSSELAAVVAPRAVPEDGQEGPRGAVRARERPGPATSFERQVASGLTLPRRIGNIYTR